MDFDRVTERVMAGLLQGFIVAFVGLAAFLPASYVMNRFIYRSWLMRLFMGVMAALTGLGGLVILMALRAYWGDEFKKLHYFGMLPIRTKEVAETVSPDRSWFVSIFLWLIQPIFPPITFYYNDEKDINGYKATIDTLLENFKNGEQKQLGVNGLPADIQPVREQTVYEPLFEFARAFGHVWKDTPDTDKWNGYISTELPIDKKYNYGDLKLNHATKIGEALFT
jgi:hypothetical protein